MKTAEITFFIKKSVQFGRGVYVSGNIPELGSWDVEKSVKLYWREGDNWIQTVKIKCSELPMKIEYKPVIRDFGGLWGAPTEWEEGPNTVMIITEESFISPTDSIFDESEDGEMGYIIKETNRDSIKNSRCCRCDTKGSRSKLTARARNFKQSTTISLGNLETCNIFKNNS